MILATPAALVGALEAIELAAAMAPHATQDERFDLALRSTERALRDLEAEPDSAAEIAHGQAVVRALHALRAPAHM